MTTIILHRRNSLTQLAGLPPESWVEVDVDLWQGLPCVAHDPIGKNDTPILLKDYLMGALAHRAAGFVFDCKRENVEKAIQPFLVQDRIENYFYLNEMEVQGDRYLAENPSHRTAVRIWQYRGARDVIRYAEDMRDLHANGPRWAWIDCWHRSIMKDIEQAHIPLTQTEALQLQKLDVKLCVCSPELYPHDYDKSYEPAELEAIYRGVVKYRQRLLHAGIQPNAVCTKFPWLWTKEMDFLHTAKKLGEA